MNFHLFSFLVISAVLLSVNASVDQLSNATSTCPGGTAGSKTSCLCQNGRDGRDGRDGLSIQGPSGRDGKDGQDGRDCIECARGPKGEAGPAGRAGKDGAKGADGAPGKKGDKGDKGPKGDAGAAGAKGPKGDKGDKGICDETILSNLQKTIADLRKELGQVKAEFASSKKDVGKAHVDIDNVKKEIGKLQQTTVKIESNKKIKQSLLPGGYSDYSVSDLQWQSIHMSVAASCRAITATGGSGDQPNRVYARSKGVSCSDVCKGTPYKECDAELTIMGNMVVAKSSKDELGRYYNYGCDDKGSLPAPSFEPQVPRDQIIKGGTFMSYCCCRLYED